MKGCGLEKRRLRCILLATSCDIKWCIQVSNMYLFNPKTFSYHLLQNESAEGKQRLEQENIQSNCNGIKRLISITWAMGNGIRNAFEIDH